MTSLKLKPLHEQTMVITGATSGIGLVTARQAAKKNAKLVLVARNEEDLRELEAEIVSSGGEVAIVAADVGVRRDVERIAETAIARFGGIDTWVNNAGVAIWGKSTEVSEEDGRRLFDTNFWGMVNGSLVAVKHLGKGGALINIGSVVSEMACPLQGMYVASKHAVKGFTETLRIELEKDELPIAVSFIKPGAIDTPIPEHARNYMKEQPVLPAPVYPPEEVAYAILEAATRPVGDVYVGASGLVLSAVRKLFPVGSDLFAKKVMFDQQKGDEDAWSAEGTLFRPARGLTPRGRHPGHVMKRSFFTRAKLNPKLSLFAASTLVALTGWIVLKNRGESRKKKLLPVI